MPRKLKTLLAGRSRCRRATFLRLPLAPTTENSYNLSIISSRLKKEGEEENDFRHRVEMK